MANVDKQILNIIDIFDKKKSGVLFEGDIIVNNIGCRFDLRYESMLPTIMKINYRSIIGRALSYHKSIDAIEIDNKNRMSYNIGTSLRVIPFFDAVSKDMGLTFVMQNISLKNVGQWLFMCSVIGNILGAKHNTSFIVDVLFEDTITTKEDLEEMKKLKLIQCEIPQMTINKTCTGKDVRDMNVDDFEIWNYYYDSLEPEKK